jgi:lipopolysaccharide export system protein LptA
MAYFRNNVVLRDTQVVLFTDSLDYDISKDIGYYLDNAQIVDSATTLTSKKGYYYHKKQAIYFKEKVVVNQNQGEYQMYTDTLKYDTKSKIAFFFGPTEFYNDSNYMYAEYGFYKTKQNKALFKNSAFYSNPKQSIEADSLFYDRDKEHGIAYSNVVATDTAQNIIVKGNYLEVFKKTESFFVTDSALLMNVMQGDTLYLHADTLYANYDTTNTYRIFRAYNHTKIFKSNFQAKTDSLYFSMADSIIRFYGSPILWAEQNQITASYIEALKNNQLSKIDVFKKSETIYFPSDEFGIIGVNKSQSTNISLILKDNKISRIIYRSSYEGAMHPMDELSKSEMKVSNFAWFSNWRPTVPTDVFIWDGNTVPPIKTEVLVHPKLDSNRKE